MKLLFLEVAYWRCNARVSRIYHVYNGYVREIKRVNIILVEDICTKHADLVMFSKRKEKDATQSPQTGSSKVRSREEERLAGITKVKVDRSRTRPVASQELAGFGESDINRHCEPI